MRYWSWVEWSLLATVVFVIALIVIAALQGAEHKTAFMRECLSLHKQFECDVLWGQANGSANSGMATGLAAGLAIGIASGRR